RIGVDDRGLAVEPPDEFDLSFPGDRLERLFKCSRAVDNLVDTATSGELAHGHMPIWRRSVIDDRVRSERPQACRLIIARGGRDDARAEQLRKLQREEGDPSRAEGENRIARFEASSTGERVPGGDRSAGERRSLFEREMFWDGDERILVQDDELGH